MFENKKCKSCGEKIKDGWDFCPFCGEETCDKECFGEGIFDDVEDEFKRIDKMFASDFQIPKIDMRMPKNNGISIIISSGTGSEPKIQVRTSGGYKQLEPQIKKNLGIKSIEEVERPVKRISKVTEEPEAETKCVGNKQIIQIKLPEIKNFKDIEIKKLEQSIEIKAFAKDKTYFKLIPIPSNCEIVDKEFKNDTLKIELEK